MKTRKFNTYYYKVIRGTATLMVGAGSLMAAQLVQAASTDDVIPKWIVTADAPLPASGASAATQLATDDAASTGAASGATTTAADDAASVFLLRTCIGNAGNCAPNGGRGSGGASASAGAAG
ncbi:hypothetical protein G3O01_34065, partial [Burkholderia sp. Ac-20365]|nr:hypothetical protein [Burkholderia sp. Ac-20365]